jgi:hypothetical protein
MCRPGSFGAQPEPLGHSAPGHTLNPAARRRLHALLQVAANVPFGATPQGIASHFTKAGKVRRVTILREAASGHPSGTAYVEFVDVESATKALALAGSLMMGRKIGGRSGCCTAAPGAARLQLQGARAAPPGINGPPPKAPGTMQEQAGARRD